MREWFNRLVSKTKRGASLTQVQILLPPPSVPVVQRTERWVPVPKVGGSIPSGDAYNITVKREFSAGGIVFKTVRSQGSGGSQVLNDKGQVLLTKHSQNHRWGFPKGWIDSGEKPEQAAVREVKEEGGVEAEIVGKVGVSKYIYTLNGEKIFKVVTIYLMKYLSGDPKDHDWEVEEAGFYPIEEALKILDYPNDKILLKKAVELRNGQ